MNPVKIHRVINGDRVRELRELRGWSQDELAVKVGVGSKTVAAWETGRSTPIAGPFLVLCQVLGVANPDDLMRDKPAHVSKPKMGRPLKRSPQLKLQAKK
jgi:transcriptional regulator with XRE-family HTH domain